MKKKIIYRVENEEGEGPYMNLVMDYVEERTFASPDTQPDPFGDNGLRKWQMRSDYMKFIFGFINLKQLKKWFPSEQLEELKNLGYRIVSYEVDSDVVASKYQAVFLADKAQKLNINLS